jgi:hypothetical protein
MGSSEHWAGMELNRNKYNSKAKAAFEMQQINYSVSVLLQVCQI